MSEQKDYILLKGNEAIAKAAYRYGYDGFFGYPITPQSEILETLALDKPWETKRTCFYKYGVCWRNERKVRDDFLVKPRSGIDAGRLVVYGGL